MVTASWSAQLTPMQALPVTKTLPEASVAIATGASFCLRASKRAVHLGKTWDWPLTKVLKCTSKVCEIPKNEEPPSELKPKPPPAYAFPVAPSQEPESCPGGAPG